MEILARFTRELRESPSVDQRSGVSARFAIAGAETIAAAAVHRAARNGEEQAVARPVDLETAVDVLGGKIEFESGEEDRADDILDHLLRTATAHTVREIFRDLDCEPLISALSGGGSVNTGEQITAEDFLAGLPMIDTLEDGSDFYDTIVQLVQPSADDSDSGSPSVGHRAAAIELALEYLFLGRRIDKEMVGGDTVYG